MKIREATLQDFDAVMLLLQQLNPADIQPTELERSVYNEIIHDKKLMLLVADNGSAVIATCYLNLIPNLTRGGQPYAIIENVVTDSAHRQQGVGRFLIDYATQCAWQHGCYKIMLMSGRASKAVHRFYRQCGFDSEEKQAYVMRRPTSTEPAAGC